MTHQHTEELAKQGDVNAIEVLINELIEPNGIKAKVGLKNKCLYVACSCAEIPERRALVTCIAKRILKLGIKSLQTAKIYAAQWGQNLPVWQQEIPLNLLRLNLRNHNTPQAQSTPQSNRELSVGMYQIQTSSFGIIVTKSQKPALEFHSQCLILLPRPLPNLIGRISQIKGALASLDKNQSTEFYGSEGVGKSALMRHLLYFTRKNSAFADGAVWIDNAYHSVNDVLQHLFELFHESNTTYKPTRGEICKFLHDKKLLIFLDEVNLSLEGIQQLQSILPDSCLVMASSSQKLSSGCSTQLTGLSKRDSVAFITQKLHKVIGSEELVTVEALANLLSGHPYMMQLAINCINKNVCTLNELVLNLQPPATNQKLIDLIVETLPFSYQNILCTLATVDRVGLSRLQIEAFNDASDTLDMLTSLLDWNLIEAGFYRYSLNPNIVPALKQKLELTPFYERVLYSLTTWAEKYPASNPLNTSETLVPILSWAAETENWKNILRLVKASEEIFFLSKRWGLWEQVLQYGLQAAIALNDKQQEAWMLHQMGSISLCFDDTNAEAQKYLASSLKIRKSLNLADEVTATNENLKLLKSSLLETTEITKYRINYTSKNTKLQFLAVALIPLLCSLFAGILAWYVISHVIISPAQNSAKNQLKEQKSVSHFNISSINLNFDKQRINTESKSQTVTIRNDGSVSLRLGEIEATAKQGDFEVNNSTCTTAILPKRVCDVSIIFAPIEIGEHRAKLLLTDSGGKILQTILVKGVAVKAAQPTSDIPTAPLPVIQTPPPLSKPKTIQPQTPQIINQPRISIPASPPEKVESSIPTESSETTITEPSPVITQFPDAVSTVEATPEVTETPILAPNQ
jgi:hypothetical protein